MQENSSGEGNSRLVSRLTTTKNLPAFSGDALEWLHFKEAHELFKEVGGYSERELIGRLFDALKGDSRENVNTLLATSHNADAVMKTPELHYGNKKTFADKIISDLKNLSTIESGKTSLVQLATMLKNATVAFKALNLTGYLHSPDSIEIIGAKLPSALQFAYNCHAIVISYMQKRS